MRPVIINGLWFCGEKIFGMKRYAYEIVRHLDLILSSENIDIDIRIAYPSSLKLCSEFDLDSFRNIKMVKLDTNGHRFSPNVLRKYVISNNGIWCHLGNGISFNRNGVVCLHDIIELETREFSTNKEVLMAYFRKWSAKIMKSTIVTVSEYQKRLICKKYKLAEDRVFVIPNGWEHVNEITADEDIFLKHPEIKKGEYYYSVGTITKHKNYTWLHEIGKKYKTRQFVIAGNIDKNILGIDDAEYRLPNLIFLGYVSDGENKALMQHCRVLLHPTKYEGFGIPPLEALSLGKRIIISNVTCLPEIYGESASYFDPDDYDVDLDELEQKPVYGADKVLEKYTWKNAARKWMNLFISLQ